MEGILMENMYVAASILLIVLLAAMVWIRVKSKSVMMLRTRTTSEEHQLDRIAMAKYVRITETIVGVTLLVTFTFALMVGYFAPYAGWYAFEVRIPTLGVVTLGIAVYVVRAVRAYRMARHIEAEFARSKESGAS